jgi:hypothetical protein
VWNVSYLLESAGQPEAAQRLLRMALAPGLDITFRLGEHLLHWGGTAAFAEAEQLLRAAQAARLPSAEPHKAPLSLGRLLLQAVRALVRAGHAAHRPPA